MKLTPKSTLADVAIAVGDALRRAGIRGVLTGGACRDRLAAYFHWNDRQSLEVALEIAIRNRVNLGKVKRWSEAEGNADRFQMFQAELRRRRVAAKKRNKKGT